MTRTKKEKDDLPAGGSHGGGGKGSQLTSTVGNWAGEGEENTWGGQVEQQRKTGGR